MLWSFSVKFCPPPPDVAFAIPTMSGSGQVGDYVTYTCADGYRKEYGGNGRRDCSTNAVWEMNLKDMDPVCVRESRPMCYKMKNF